MNTINDNEKLNEFKDLVTKILIQATKTRDEDGNLVERLNKLKDINNILPNENISLVDIGTFGYTNYEYTLDKEEYMYNFVSRDVIEDFYENYSEEILGLIASNYPSFYETIFIEDEESGELNLNYDEKLLIEIAFTIILNESIIPKFENNPNLNLDNYWFEFEDNDNDNNNDDYEIKF